MHGRACRLSRTHGRLPWMMILDCLWVNFWNSSKTITKEIANFVCLYVMLYFFIPLSLSVSPSLWCSLSRKVFLCSLDLYVHVPAARSKSMVLGELSRVSRPCSPLDQEKALKAGWLKRQRSIMKNWQLRWFVLRTEALYFYKDQDETKAQVTLKNETQTRPYITCCLRRLDLFMFGFFMWQNTFCGPQA